MNGEAQTPAGIDVPGNDMASILLHAVDIGASDIHICVADPPLYRVNGSVVPTNLPVLTRERVHMMLYDVLDDEQRKRFERDKELDFALEFGTAARFRVNCFYSYRGEGAVFRVVPTKIRTMEELRLPEPVRRIAEKRRGIALVTGPTGSGKSTTLAAMIDWINTTRDEHILTVEDPIEFVHPNKRCIVNQREVGRNTASFASALRSALREDPDVILVGEMRDLETISLALTAAETGHLVFGTLHTQSAVKTCDRIIDVFPPEQQQLVRVMFSESFQAVVCQSLVPRRDGKGRVAALEIMLGVSATRSLIREGKTYQLSTILQTNQKLGMQTLDMHLKELLDKGIISERDALLKAHNPDNIVVGGMDKLDAMIAKTAATVAKGGPPPKRGVEAPAPSPAPANVGLPPPRAGMPPSVPPPQPGLSGAPAMRPKLPSIDLPPLAPGDAPPSAGRPPMAPPPAPPSRMPGINPTPLKPPDRK